MKLFLLPNGMKSDLNMAEGQQCNVPLGHTIIIWRHVMTLLKKFTNIALPAPVRFNAIREIKQEDKAYQSHA